MQLVKYVPDYVVFDLETTGISHNYDEVIEISAIKVHNHEVVTEFTSLVNPKRGIPHSASQVNGITDDTVRDAPIFEEVLDDFLEFVDGHVLVGHNIHAFDMKFIYRDCKRFFDKALDKDYIDTLKLARICLPHLQHHKLTDLADYYGITTTGAHRALNDCRMNQAVFEHLGEEIKKKPSLIKKCPKCGQLMHKRNGKFGMFWGCGGYPGCRYTENL